MADFMVYVLSTYYGIESAARQLRLPAVAWQPPIVSL